MATPSAVAHQNEPPDEPDGRLQALLDDALASLAEHVRTPLVAHLLQGRSYAEIGPSLGITPDAARMRVTAGIEKMRRHLARRGVHASAVAIVAVLDTSQTVVESGFVAACTEQAVSVSAAPPAVVAAASTISAPTWAGLGLSAAAVTMIAISAAAWWSSERSPAPATASPAEQAAWPVSAVADDPAPRPAASLADHRPLLDQPISVAWRHARLGQALAAVDAQTWLQFDGPPFDASMAGAQPLLNGVHVDKPLRNLLDALCASTSPEGGEPRLSWTLVGDRVVFSLTGEPGRQRISNLIAWVDGLPAGQDSPLPFFLPPQDLLAPEAGLAAALDRAAERVDFDALSGGGWRLFARARHPRARSEALRILALLTNSQPIPEEASGRVANALDALRDGGEPTDLAFLSRWVASHAASVADGLTWTPERVRGAAATWAGYDAMAAIVRRSVGVQEYVDALIERTASSNPGDWRTEAELNCLAMLGSAQADRCLASTLDRWIAAIPRLPNAGLADDAPERQIWSAQWHGISTILGSWSRWSPDAMALWALATHGRLSGSSAEQYMLFMNLLSARCQSPAFTQALLARAATDGDSAQRWIPLLAEQARPDCERLIVSAPPVGGWTSTMIDAIGIYSRQPGFEPLLLAAARGESSPVIENVLALLVSGDASRRPSMLVTLLKAYQTPAAAAAAARLEGGGMTPPRAATATPAERPALPAPRRDPAPGPGTTAEDF